MNNEILLVVIVNIFVAVTMAIFAITAAISNKSMGCGLLIFFIPFVFLIPFIAMGGTLN